jgi:hypothetical protein
MAGGDRQVVTQPRESFWHLVLVPFGLALARTPTLTDHGSTVKAVVFVAPLVWKLEPPHTP